MKQKYIFRTTFLLFLLMIGINSSMVYGQGGGELTDFGKFEATPNYVYVIGMSDGIIHRIDIKNKYNASENKAVRVTKKKMILNGNIVDIGDDAINLKTEILRRTGIKYKIDQFNGLGMSQDGRYAYSILNAANVKVPKGKNAVAIVRYDTTKGAWEILSTVNEWGNDAPNTSNRYFTKGGYDPVSHSFIFSTTEGLNNSDFEPSSKGKYVERFWSYDINEGKFKTLGYIVPNFGSFFWGKDESKISLYAFNGDLLVRSNGDLIIMFNAKVNGTVKMFRYKIPYKTLKEAMEDPKADRKLHSEIMKNLNGAWTDFPIRSGYRFNGAAVDTNGEIYISDGTHVWGLYPDNQYRSMPLYHDKTVAGSSWSDMATVPGHFVMVKYEDEGGHQLQDEVFSNYDLLNDAPYDTTTSKPTMIRKNGVTYRILKKDEGQVKAGSDPETGTVFDKDYFVTYVYTPSKPKGEPKTTLDAMGVPQKATPIFKNADDTPIVISASNPAKLVKADGSLATTGEEVPAMKDGQQIGTYTINEETGEVTFTPNNDFFGTPEPAKVQTTDVYGDKVETTYTPTVVPNPVGVDKTSSDIQGFPQTGKPEFIAQDAVNAPIDETKPAKLLDADGNEQTSVPAMKDGKTTFTAKDGTEKPIGTYTIAEDGTVTFTPNPEFVGTPEPARVQRQTIKICDLTDGEHPNHVNKVVAEYAPTVTPVTPTGEHKTTEGLQGQEQSEVVNFTPGDSRVPFEGDLSTKPQFEDPNNPGSYVNTVTIQGEGTYTIDETGKVIFTPEEQFGANGTLENPTLGTKLKVVRKDKNGTLAKGSYQAKVIPVKPTAVDATNIDYQGIPQKGKPVFKAGSDIVPITEKPVFVDANGNVLTEPVSATMNGKKTFTAKDGTEKPIGTYTMDTDGTVTFTPNPEFVGKPDPVTVQVKDENGTKVTATFTPEVLPVTPIGTPKETADVQGKAQTGEPVFVPGIAKVPMAPTEGTNAKPAKLKKADGTLVSTLEVFDENNKKIGTYTVEPDGKTIKFQPEPDFVGTAPSVTVVREDINGTPAEAKYTPTVTAVKPTAKPKETTDIQGKEQSAEVEFTAGHTDVPMKDATTNPAKIKKADGTLVSTLETPQGTYTVDTDGKTIKFQPKPDFVGVADGVTVVREDINGTPAEAKYTPTVTAVKPTAKPKETTDIQGKEQSAEVEFTAGHTDVPMKDATTSPAKIKKADGTLVSTLETPQGTYTIDTDGKTIKFQPKPDFVGVADGVTVVREDINGTPAEAKYTPTVTAVKPTAKPKETSDIQGKEQSAEVEFTAGHTDVPMKDTTTSPAKIKKADGTLVSTLETPQGTYTVDTDGKTIKFQPKPDFVGVADGVTVVREDINGTPAEAKYTPTVTAVKPTAKPKETSDIQGKEQSAEVEFTAGHTDVPMKDATTSPAKIKKADGTLVSTLETPQGTYTVDTDGKTIKFQPKPDFVGVAEGVTVVREDINGTPAEAKYTPTVTAVKPTAEVATSVNAKGYTQTGKPKFTAGDISVPMDDAVPATFEDGTTKKVVSGEGTYTVAPDGTVTFTPEPNFVGQTKGVTVVRQDINGTKASAKYIPTVIEGPVTTKWVDTNGNELKYPVVGDSINPKGDFDGYKFIDTEVSADGKEVTYIFAKLLDTTFVDENGKPIPGFDKITDVDGKPKKDIPNYKFIETKVDADGNVKHIYKKLVKTEFVDTDGNELETPILDEKGQPSKDIPKYKIVDTITDAKGNVKHIYKKLVDTDFVDAEGKPIPGFDKITDVEGKPKKDISGYEFVKTETDSEGNVKHIYKKVLKTEFVDENGKTLSPEVKGAQGSKEIKGYVLAKTEVDAEGNVKHIYKKTEPQCEMDSFENKDNDGDGVTNGQELKDGTNPLDPCDYKEASQDKSKVTEECKCKSMTKDKFKSSIPKGFSPDGNQKNELFEVEGLEYCYPNFRLRVYNRWGNLVFDSEKGNRKGGKWWDGYSNGRWNVLSKDNKVPVGTYFYILEFDKNIRISNKENSIQGWVYVNH